MKFWENSNKQKLKHFVWVLLFLAFCFKCCLRMYSGMVCGAVFAIKPSVSNLLIYCSTGVCHIITIMCTTCLFTRLDSSVPAEIVYLWSLCCDGGTRVGLLCLPCNIEERESSPSQPLSRRWSGCNTLCFQLVFSEVSFSIIKYWTTDNIQERVDKNYCLLQPDWGLQ